MLAHFCRHLFRCILHHRGSSHIAPEKVRMLPVFKFDAIEKETDGTFEGDVIFHTRR
jgi:hypothetical protein